MKALVVCKHPKNAREFNECKIIKINGLEVFYSWKNALTERELKDIDFIITMGGDGTALSTSHFIKNQPMLAVNLNPNKSEGALTSIPFNLLEQKLKEIIRKENREEKYVRIEVKINNKPIDFLALNEVFIGNAKPYIISRYKIKFKQDEEEQKSSGLIVATGAGSTAWFKSAGGIPFNPTERIIKMIIREPYKGKLSNPKITSLTIKEGEELIVIPKTKLILSIDSIREISLSEGEEVKIRISKTPLIKIV